MAADNGKVLTAPLAIIKIKGVTVGKIKNIRVQEQYQRGDVKGIGALISQEKPILGIQCSFSCSSYVVSVSKLGTIDNPFVLRGATTTDQFVNTVLTQDNGVDIYIMKKGAKVVNAAGIVTEASEENMFVIKNVFLTSNSFDVQEGQIAGSDMSGEYLEPILSAQ